MRVIATAGHVDHGKSTLVGALTGVNPDRWEEERRRGLTIDLGFAAARLPSGESFAFVDVPGHVRFIKNMLAGVGSVDACCFVVAANEGWKPQSEEHLRILELLGVTHGLIVLTKSDLVDEELLEIAKLEVEDRVAGTFLAKAETVAVDSLSGRGMAEFGRALARLLARTPEATDNGRARLWVDRSFVIQGSGTVVTGTLIGGGLKRGEELLVCPGGRKARIRALQTLGETRERIPPGRRCALNLAWVNREQIKRGDALVRPGEWHQSGRVDASLQVLKNLSHEVSRRGAFVAYLGSGEFPVRLRLLGNDALSPGESGAVRLFLPQRLPLLPGDRYVLRESGRNETVGGGEVLDVDPRLPASRARPDRNPDRVIAERGWMRTDELLRLTGASRKADVGRWLVSPQALSSAKGGLLARIAEAGPLGLDLAALDQRQRALLELMDGIESVGGRVRTSGIEDPLANHSFLAELETRPFNPPEPRKVDPRELSEMLRRSLIISREGAVFPSSAVTKAAKAASALLKKHPGGFTVAQFRDALSTTRKFALPLLAELDERGITSRKGDLRLGGPRLSEMRPAEEGS